MFSKQSLARIPKFVKKFFDLLKIGVILQNMRDEASKFECKILLLPQTETWKYLIGNELGFQLDGVD